MTTPLKDDRELIFRRIGEALRIQRAHVEPHRDADAYRKILPAVGASLDDRIARFREWSERLQTEFIVCGGEDFSRTLADLSRHHRWTRGACHGAGWARKAIAAAGLDDPIGLLIDDTGRVPYDKHALEACDVGFSACDALVAQTGSILLTARSAGGRALSVLPPHHVVIATADQLVPDLPAAMALIRDRHGADMPSLVALHTGPSRTGDIERTIVLGAHGPKKLTVVLILP